jgi:hypothetical protein
MNCLFLEFSIWYFWTLTVNNWNCENEPLVRGDCLKFLNTMVMVTQRFSHWLEKMQYHPRPHEGRNGSCLKFCSPYLLFWKCFFFKFFLLFIYLLAYYSCIGVTLWHLRKWLHSDSSLPSFSPPSCFLVALRVSCLLGRRSTIYATAPALRIISSIARWSWDSLVWFQQN